MREIVVDTGMLYALADPADRWHSKCKKFLEEIPDPLITPVTTLPEACYLINKRLGPEAEIEFMSSCSAGDPKIENLLRLDIERAVQLMREWVGHNIGFVDATVVAIAERLRITRILTSDRRHFSLFRPRHCPAFILLP